ncbi:mycothiol transferase [Amycolatopsis anabasis]|uniref:mycothiol transferase n=1 Tax=Amycolatopsis anabasis TaxID=1840409 RepID=UPI00131DC512|nr:DUF664 domain-containing protein [Amycolatopsis anabasis]
MNVAEVLTDGYERVRGVVHDAVDGLDAEQLSWRADADANSIAWLVWHLTRVQDSHIAEVADREQVWISDGWYDRFGLSLAAEDTGYAHDPDEVAAVRVTDPDLLTGYYDATHEQTVRYLSGLTDADLDRVVDRNWSPPVTLGVRLVSVLDDDIQHAGQAAFVRGLLLRR